MSEESHLLKFLADVMNEKWRIKKGDRSNCTIKIFRLPRENSNLPTADEFLENNCLKCHNVNAYCDIHGLIKQIMWGECKVTPDIAYRLGHDPYKCKEYQPAILISLGEIKNKALHELPLNTLREIKNGIDRYTKALDEVLKHTIH